MSWQIVQAHLLSDERHRHLRGPLDKLYPIFGAPTLSEFMACLTIYQEMLKALPAWQQLPYSGNQKKLVDLHTVLASQFADQITTPIDTTHSHRRYPIWTTLRSVEHYYPNALTGLLAVMLLTQPTQPDLAVELASALRGRKKIIKRKAGPPPSDQRLTLHDILTSTDACNSPAELISSLLDAQPEINIVSEIFA